MNILILTKTFPDSDSDWSGNFVREQAEAISSIHNVTIIKVKVNYNQFSPFFRYKIEKVQTINFNFFQVVVSKSFPVYNQLNFLITSFFGVMKILKGEKIDIIHCHYSYPSGVIAWLLKRRLKVPFIITEHSKMTSTFRSFFHKRLSVLALRRSDKVIAVSNSLSREIANLKIRNIDVVPNVLDVNRFPYIKRDNKVFTIGFLGNLNSYNKGLDILMKSCSSLKFEYRLLIGGTGILLEEFKKLSKEINVADETSFLGNLEPRETINFYCATDLFVLPSRYETFGVVLLEALSTGIPVIATKCGGPEDIITDDSGLLVDTEDSTQLCNAIEYVHENYNKYNPDKLHCFVNEEYGYKTFANKMDSIYRTCIGAAQF